MDRDRFDALARLLATPGSRRAALGTLLGAGLLGTNLGAGARKKAKHRDKAKNKAKKRMQRTRAEAAAGCCKSGACTLGPGKNLTRCCLERQTLTGKSFKGSNLTEANFHGANLSNANFDSTNMTRACLVRSTITGAKFKGANQSGIIKCRTVINSAGDRDNSGCDRLTPCCPECIDTDDCDPCQQCVSGQCQAVPDFTVACNGSSLSPVGVLRCTTQPNTGVCVGGTCRCASAVYDEPANACRCSDDSFCLGLGCQGCQINRVCLSTVDGGSITNDGCFGCPE
jgi:hypothetical protein